MLAQQQLMRRRRRYVGRPGELPGDARRQLTVDRLALTITQVAASAPVAERVALLNGVEKVLEPQRRDASISKALQDKLVELVVLIERALPASGSRYGRTFLTGAADLCQRIARTVAARNPYWRCIVLSLRAECLFALGLAEDAQTALLASELAFEQIGEPRGLAGDRHSFNRTILDGGDASALATSQDYIQALIKEIDAH
jgi:hypothetical protein